MDRLKGGGIVVENWIAFVEILLKGQPGFVALNKTLKALDDYAVGNDFFQ